MEIAVTPGSAQRPIRVDVALVPEHLPQSAEEEREEQAGVVYVVIDVIRATTTLCVLFEQGCRRVLVAPSVAAARDAARTDGAGALLAGEVGGLAPPGFDYGNSPRELAAAEVAEREVIFATTNGTRALRACLGGRAILAGAFRNAGAVTAWALASLPAATAVAPSPASAASGAYGPHSTDGPDAPAVASGARARRASEADLGWAPPDIVFVCSGRDKRPAFDDTVCAGYLVERLLAHAAAARVPVTLREGARIARASSASALAAGDLRAALAVSDAARAVERVGLSDDLRWCADVDVTSTVPAVTGVRPGDGLLIMEAVGTAEQPHPPRSV